MIHQEFCQIFKLVANDKWIRTSAITVTTIFAFSIFFSPLTGLVIYGCYILGYVAGWGLLKYQDTASGYLRELVDFCYGASGSRRKLKQSCSVCNDLSCKRHKQGRLPVPWKDLYIHKELNDAIEKFYNSILENFVISWYGQFTDDVDFINELRYCLRYASATVIARFLEIDHAYIISTKLLPCIVKHIDDYLYMQQIVKIKKHPRLNDVMVEYLGKRLHAAVINRRNELSYLQHLTTTLIPNLLPENYWHCGNFLILMREILAGWVFLPLMDMLADPSIINSLVILSITYKSKRSQRKKESGDKVVFLENFATNSMQKSSFATDLNTIKRNTNLLYPFMKFLEREEHVHLLQFCLDVDEFNDKLLTPDLSKKQLEELHAKALTLYKEYLDKNDVKFIGCPENIVRDYYALLKDGVYNVAKLRTSKPLFQAYEYTLTVLEKEWLPSFFHSNEFFSQMCGEKVTAAYSKASSSRSLDSFDSPTKLRLRKFADSSTSQGTVAKISSGLGKIRGALKVTQPIDGALYAPETQTIENGTVDDIIISECGSIFRDLSMWRISILSYQTINKTVSFCINVQRLDVVDEYSKRHWVVMRKDQDFYTLKAKLVEFHGEDIICKSPLPPRKAGSSIEVRMKKYEEFVEKLLRIPSLRGSDLLFSFLTTEEDFTVLIATSQNAQDIGNIYHSVAHKLRKERGQHLDPFMATFLQSTRKTKSGKSEWIEYGDEAEIKIDFQGKHLPTPKTFRSSIFNDNFGIKFRNVKDSGSTPFYSSDIIQCVFYLLKYVFKVPHYLLRLYAAICSVAQEAVEAFAGFLIERRLKHSMSSANLTYLIKLLEDAIFNPHSSPTYEELQLRKVKAFTELEHVVPSYMEKIVGSDFGAGLKVLLEILQHPHYNKQLVYTLFDLLLVEMYPTLQKTKDV